MRYISLLKWVVPILIRAPNVSFLAVSRVGCLSHLVAFLVLLETVSSNFNIFIREYFVCVESVWHLKRRACALENTCGVRTVISRDARCRDQSIANSNHSRSVNSQAFIKEAAMTRHP
jgi:hypothetical protein